MTQLEAINKAKKGKLPFTELKQWRNRIQLLINDYKKMGIDNVDYLEKDKRIFDKLINKRFK